MKKIIRNISIVLIFIASIITLNACNDIADLKFVFADETEYALGEEINFINSYIVIQQTIGSTTVLLDAKNYSTESDLSTVGIKTFKVTYEDFEVEFNIWIKYRINFLDDDESIIKTQFVLTVDDIIYPIPVKTGYSFIGWDQEINEITNNLNIYATYEVIDILTKLDASYGDTLADVILPVNEEGIWSFESPLTTNVGNIGENTFNVKYTPNDPKSNSFIRSVIINVGKKEIIFEDIIDEVTYNGELQSVSFSLDDNYALLGIVEYKNVGVYPYEISIIDDNYCGTITGNFVIKKADITLKAKDIESFYNEDIKELEYEIISGSIFNLDDLKIELIKEVGLLIDDYLITITANNDNYKITLENGVYSILKLIPVLALDEELQDSYYAVYGDSLNSIILPNGWVFIDPLTTVVGNAGINKFNVKYIPLDTELYQIINSEITINVSKLDPIITSYPIASNITCDDTLSNSIISGGNANINGTFSFKDETIKPTLGTHSYYVVFKPLDENYNDIEFEILVTAKNLLELYVNNDSNLIFKAFYNKTTTDQLELNLTLNNNQNSEILVDGYELEKIVIQNFGYFKYHISVLESDLYTSLDTYIEAYIYTVGARLRLEEEDLERGYLNLEEALLTTYSGYIYIYNDMTLESNKTYALNKHVTLYLPCDYLSTIDSTAKTSFTTSLPNPTEYISLTLEEGAIFNVYGTIEVNAILGTYSTKLENVNSKNYAKIVLKENSKININNEGRLNVFGYIEGLGSIEVMSGGILYEVFSLTNWRGGTCASKVYAQKISPLSEYNMRNITVSTKINYGATLTGFACIYASSAFNVASYNIIGIGSILEIKNEESYIIKNVIDDKVVIELYGTIIDNPGELSVSGISLASKDIPFPIHYGLKIVVKNGAYVTLRYKYKLLPGAEFIVEKDATLEIKGSISIYTYWLDYGYYSDTATYYPTGEITGLPQNFGSYLYDMYILETSGALKGQPMVDEEGNIILTKEYAKFLVYGTVILSNGSIGGDIVMLEDAIIDLTNALSLTVETKEGYGNKTHSYYSTIIEVTRINGALAQKIIYNQLVGE